MFTVLLQKNYLNSQDALNSRCVCKTWKQSVDEYYRTANLNSVTFDDGSRYAYPKAVIIAPISARQLSTRLNMYVNHGGNPFLGHRLLLKCCYTDATLVSQSSSLASLIQSDHVSHVWQYVQHVEICEEEEANSSSSSSGTELNDSQWKQKFGPYICAFLEMMTNVKTLKLWLVNAAAAKAILEAMPDLSALEQLVVASRYGNSLTNYSRLVQACRSNLKLLSVPEAMVNCLVRNRRLQFPHLEELCFNDFYRWPTKMFCKEVIDDVFPKVKVMGLAFWGHWFHFYKIFISITHAFKVVRYIHVRCMFGTQRDTVAHSKWFDGFRPNSRRVRKGLDKLVLVNVTNSWRPELFVTIVRNFQALFEMDDICFILGIFPPEDDEDDETV